MGILAKIKLGAIAFHAAWSGTMAPTPKAASVAPAAVADPPKAAPIAPQTVRMDPAVKAELTAFVEQGERELLARLGTVGKANAMMMSVPIPAKNPRTGAFGLADPWKYVNTANPSVHPGSIVTVQTLRDLVANYDVLGSIIAHLQREVSNAPFTIVAKQPGDDLAETTRQIQEATEFFSKRGGLGGHGEFPWQFEYSWIADLCTVGAAAFFLWPTQSGGLHQVVAVNSATIKPLIDGYGWQPFEDDVAAFEQWIYGVPVQHFTRAEMMYDGIYKRTNTPYYLSPVENLITTIMAALSADQWNRDWLVDGNVPDQIYALPESWTPSMVREYQEYFDAILAGNIRMRTKAKFVPGGTKMIDPKSRSDQEFQEFELWLLKRCCSAFGVTPASIGYADGQFKGTQDASLDMTSAFGVGAILTYKVAHYNEFLAQAGWDLVQYQHVNERYEKPGDRALRNQGLVMNGIKKINEARQDEGLDPVPDGDTLIVQSAMIPLDVALKAPKIPTNAGQSVDKRDNASKTERGDALLTWQRKALNALDRGKSPAVPFDSPSLDAHTTAVVRAALGACTDKIQVRTVIDAFLVIPSQE